MIQTRKYKNHHHHVLITIKVHDKELKRILTNFGQERFLF